MTFWACHRAAFAHFGGVPRELLYDRTKTVVRAHVGRERSLGENVFHPEALASAHHYGFSLRLCKAYRPQTKGKVESDVPYVRERLLRAHGFGSYEHANRAWAPGTRTSPAGACTAPTARSSPSAPSVTAPRSARCRAAPYLVVERTTRVVARDGLLQLRGPPLRRPRRAARRARRARPRRRRRSRSTRPPTGAGSRATSAAARAACSRTRSRTRCRWRRCSARSRIPRSIAGRCRSTRTLIDG